MPGAKTTTDEILAATDLRGRRYLVTGASAGLGVETVRALVSRGADVVGTARDLGKGKRATEHASATAQSNGGSLELVELDLASLASVRAAADLLVKAGQSFDAIIANAGVMATPPGKTSDGFETQFGTNHLGHFVLVNRLAGLLKPGGRVVMLSSSAHRFADVDLTDPNFETTDYDPIVSYGRSKTANSLFAVEFDRRHRERDIRAVAVHPGAIRTELERHMGTSALEDWVKNVNETNAANGIALLEWKSIPQGAATSVWAAIVADADAVGGRFCEDCHVAAFDDSAQTESGVKSYALDAASAKALWSKSEQLVGESFS